MNKFLPFIPCSFCISLNIAFTNASSTTSAASTFASNASIKVGICSKFKNPLHSSVSNSTVSPKNILACSVISFTYCNFSLRTDTIPFINSYLVSASSSVINPASTKNGIAKSVK